MGYQALLFCPDEKLARIVSQVFSELDFSVEAVKEPFSAVKKLMAQRYDALVVNCENESNASLLFRSARNSSSNQGTLAIAVVEGQAGVAKAYRIGANLVLTKPINVEQAKGTLRVARGLLRKGTDASGSNAGTPAAPAFTTAAYPAAENSSPIAAAGVGAKATREVPEFETIAPEMAAPARVAEAPHASAAAEGPAKNTGSETPAPVVSASPSVTTAPGASAAPAKAPEIPRTKKDVPEFEPVGHGLDADASSVADVPSAPSFAALSAHDSGGASGSKKGVVIAVAIVVLAALGYFGWTAVVRYRLAKPTASTPESSSAAPETAVPGSAAQHAAAMREATASASPAAGGSTVPRLQLDSDPERTTQDASPIVVKNKPKTHTRAAGDEPAAPAPNALATGGGDESVLTNLVASSNATPTTPTLATLKISQGVAQGLLIKRVNPKYPASALSIHAQGTVLLEATINREGKVVNPTVLKGDKVLARAAIDAVRQWRYKPYYLDGAPVEIQTQITINFKLPN